MAAENVTELLREWQQGNSNAMEALMPIIYEELRRIAKRNLRREEAGHTLETGALVNEAYLRLIDQNTSWHNRTHFFSIAAQMMRRVLVDHARSRLSEKRGGWGQRVSLSGAARLPGVADDVLALNDALTGLSALDQRQGQIVELKFFGGMKIDEIAEVMGISTATVEREWRGARAWLVDHLDRDRSSR